MLKETILAVQTFDLKVDINCHGCIKKIKKIMQKIDGVYQTSVDRQQGKVTITGQFDIDRVLEKLIKSKMSAQLWDDANSSELSKHQKPQLLGGSDRGDQLKDVGGKGLPQQGEASNNGGSCGASGGTNDARVVLPQLTPTLEQHLPTIQQQIEQRLRMLNREQLPPQPKGMPPPPGGLQSGKKICGGTKVQVPENANNFNKNDVGTKIYQDAGGSQVKNGVIGQPPYNGALVSSLHNNHGQAKKDISVGVGSQMMGGRMAPPKGGMMGPPNNMIGPTSFPSKGKTEGMSMGPYPYFDGYNMQPYGGDGAIHGLGMHTSSLPRVGFYPSGAGGSGTEMMQQVGRNPMPQQPYMMMQPQQEHEMMMMNAHFPHSQNAHYGPGGTGYQLMGYDNGHAHLQQQYPPPMYNPMPQPPQHDNIYIFSDENPNVCSLM